MHRPFLVLGFVLALLAVAAGAFGAHGLEGVLPADRLETFEVAVRYQMYHALALIGIGLAAGRWPGVAWNGPGLLLALGTAVFSGSLYALALGGGAAFGVVAPAGGACLLAGWAWGAWVAIRRT